MPQPIHSVTYESWNVDGTLRYCTTLCEPKKRRTRAVLTMKANAPCHVTCLFCRSVMLKGWTEITA